MTNRYVTPCPLPSAYEREILVILMEECAEVAVRTSKLIRFGRDECQPGQMHSNRARLSAEVGDLLAMIDMAADAGLIFSVSDLKHLKNKKISKLSVYMQTLKQE